MEHRISSTDLARTLGDVLGRVRDLGDSFLIERNGDPVARLVPVPGTAPATVREGLKAWSEAGEPETEFADALDLINASDEDPGDS